MSAHRLSTRLVRTAAAVTAAATALAAAACGDSSSGGTGDSAAQGAGKTLTVWIMEGTNPDAKPFFEKVKSDFRSQTGADVNVQFVPWSAAHDKFVAAVGGGETPDVAEVGTTWTPEFGEAGVLADLTDRVKGAGVSGDLVDSLVKAGELDGKMYGMPWYAGVRSVIYRKDVFDELGLTPPQNWDDLVAVATKIKNAKPDLVPFPVPGNSEYGVYPFIWGAGGQIAVQDNGKWRSALDSAQARRGIEFYTGLATRQGLSSPAASTWKETEVLDNFVQGKLAMAISGSWTPKTIMQKAPQMEGKVGAFPIPGEKSGISPSFVGGSHLAVFEKSKNADLAWKFVQMMTTGQYASDWASQSSYFPGLKSLLEKSMAQPNPLVAPFAKQMKDGGETVPVTPSYGKVQAKKTVPAMLQAILSGQKTVEQATSDAAAEMTSVLQG